MKNPTPTTDWHNSSHDDSHQKESLLMVGSNHWGRKFHYGFSTTQSPPAEPSLVRPNTPFYLLTCLVGYYLLGQFSSMMGRFTYLYHFGHLAMVTVPIGFVIAEFNLGALAYKIGYLFSLKWVLNRDYGAFFGFLAYKIGDLFPLKWVLNRDYGAFFGFLAVPIRFLLLIRL
ncbi:hypothetical protein DSO57_1035083 [Entomophthora muscae]|uniref:Uncharacterized protein n=1 Tax=Entomophthora muscae TaxID=34485 RepID=A0ACC2U907_9FUNG|nr:hypothetical protein DSO57_1035083 [Entomophthora muscae]